MTTGKEILVLDAETISEVVANGTHVVTEAKTDEFGDTHEMSLYDYKDVRYCSAKLNGNLIVFAEVNEAVKAVKEFLSSTYEDVA